MTSEFFSKILEKSKNIFLFMEYIDCVDVCIDTVNALQ